MKMLKQQSGAVVTIAVISFIILVITGAVGYKVYRGNNTKIIPTTAPTPTPSNTQTNTSQDIKKGTGTLSGQVYCTSLDSRQPCATRIEIENTTNDSRNGSYIQPIVVVTSGKFSVELEPGTYTLVPARKPDYPHFIPGLSNPVEIKAGQTTSITISYHDGTR